MNEGISDHSEIGLCNCSNLRPTTTSAQKKRKYNGKNKKKKETKKKNNNTAKNIQIVMKSGRGPQPNKSHYSSPHKRTRRGPFPHPYSKQLQRTTSYRKAQWPPKKHPPQQNHYINHSLRIIYVMAVTSLHTFCVTTPRHISLEFFYVMANPSVMQKNYASQV